ITANTQNNLKLTFFDAFTEQQVTGDVNYDLKILDKDGNTAISETGLKAKGGIDTQLINLPSNGIYRIEINIKSIVNNGIPDTSRIGIGRGDLVIPSTVKVPEFGPVTSLVLVIAIVSVVTVTAKTRLR
ncbi:MAG TPA: PEFG-CTERM sorting domain-containing protein, partial [Nitrosopumilaceae archaeon]|nr:PEFG-CTERM sorting domain-containing protein [Nitrosopumilaceae archaeon]